MLNPFTNRSVIRNGEHAKAWIRHMPNPPRGRNPRDCEMTIDVERPSGVRYEVEDRWTVAADEPVSVGSELSVLIDRENPRRVVIDWDATREIYRQKTAERRELLSRGVPVPLHKLKPVNAPPAAPALPVTKSVRGPVPASANPPSGERTVPTPAKPPARVQADPEHDAGEELLTRLERLAALHASGELTDAEFAAVKRQLLA